MPGGWTWFLIDILFVAVLAALLVYGIAVTRRRQHDRVVQRKRDEATGRLYRTEAGKRHEGA
jgi:hypothetical protein